MNEILAMATDLIRAWRKKNSGWSRALIVVAGVFTLLSIVSIPVSEFLRYQLNLPIGDALTISLGGIAFITALSVVLSVRTEDQQSQREKMEAVERRAEESPDEPRAAWDLARVKLESYLDRNLSQVRSIFWLTVVVMLIGFGLIVYGVFRVFETPEVLNPSLVSAISGVLVSFIGATMLTIYRSTMSQAKDYVTILERINAVGMSIQVLETIQDNSGQLKDETTASIAKQLLSMYGNSTEKP